MIVITRAAVACLALASLVAGGQPGHVPRKDALQYPAHAEGSAVALGAAVLTPEQARSTFVSDLNRGYVVVEIGVYPKGNPIDLSRTDFVLRIAGTEDAAKPASPKLIAAKLQKTAPVNRDITVYPSVGVGYESGPRTYDPVTGRQRGGGVYTSTGVGVGVGETRPAATDRDREIMELELEEKGLPEGNTAKPVAGYLYFPMPATKKKPVTYQLEYDGPGGMITLSLVTRK